MNNVAIPLGSPLDPKLLIEFAKGDYGGSAPILGWVPQVALDQNWSASLHGADGTYFSVWGRVPGKQATAVILWSGDSANTGTRYLREDGTLLGRESTGSHFIPER